MTLVLEVTQAVLALLQANRCFGVQLAIAVRNRRPDHTLIVDVRAPFSRRAWFTAPGWATASILVDGRRVASMSGVHGDAAGVPKQTRCATRSVIAVRSASGSSLQRWVVTRDPEQILIAVIRPEQRFFGFSRLTRRAALSTKHLSRIDIAVCDRD